FHLPNQNTMDAIKILGSLLSNNAMGSPAGGNILDSLLGADKPKSGAGDILGTLLGGQKRSGSGAGGLGALGAILAAAASSRGGTGGSAGMDILGSLLGGGGGSDLLGSLLGGGTTQKSSSGGGLGGLLGGLLGGGSKKSSSGSGLGGAGALLGSLLSAQSGSGGSPLSSILGMADQGSTGSDMLGALLGGGTPQTPPKEAQDEAETLIAAMCNAAKADGTIDEGEKEAILGRLGDLDEEEIAYLREHLTGAADVDSFAGDVPDDMDEQVYAFSLMAIKLDTEKEAKYFGELANALGLSGDTCNQIHKQLGQPEIFA
ncbi:MAG: DUF533 domain-containing protein, partial [Verrucomicrobiota bacterium]